MPLPSLAGPRHDWAAPVIVLAALGPVAALLWAMGTTSYDTWGFLLVAPALVAVTLPAVLALANQEADPRLGVLMVAALVLKVSMAVPRYLVNVVFYDGSGDAFRYYNTGSRIFVDFRELHLPAVDGKVPGTGMIELYTGAVFAITGPSLLAGFAVFSWLGYLGLLLFFRAFRIAVPTGDAWRYGCLVLLLPSLLFWPSSIGKEAYMMFALGLAAYGTARVLAAHGTSGGVLWLVLGVLGMSMVRPHLTVLVVAALLVAFLLRRSRRQSLLGPLGKAVALSLIAGAAYLAVGQAETYFGVSDEQGGAAAALDEAAHRTDQGGSNFEATRVTSPTQLPWAAVTVLLRPFPHEANSLQALVSSLEGVLLVGLALAARRRLRALPRLLVSNPYIAFVVTYTLLFVVAFSAFGNFGILTRQRVQVFPFVLVLLALPLAGRDSVVGSAAARPTTSAGRSQGSMPRGLPHAARTPPPRPTAPRSNPPLPALDGSASCPVIPGGEKVTDRQRDLLDDDRKGLRPVALYDRLRDPEPPTSDATGVER